MGHTNTEFTWKGKDLPKPTSAECLASCIGNAEEAARRCSAARALVQRTGDPQAKYEATKAHHEQIHWRESANFFREQIVKEAREQLAAQTRQDTARRLLAEGKPLVDRDTGADDEDEDEPTSAWADIGGAVGGGR
jgi:hypothetical protein